MPGVWGQDISGSLKQPLGVVHGGLELLLGSGKSRVGERVASSTGHRDQLGLNTGNAGRHVAGLELDEAGGDLSPLPALWSLPH